MGLGFNFNNFVLIEELMFYYPDYFLKMSHSSKGHLIDNKITQTHNCHIALGHFHLK